MFGKRRHTAEGSAHQCDLLNFIETSILGPNGEISLDAEGRLQVYLREHGYANERGGIDVELLPHDAAHALQLGVAVAGRPLPCPTTLLLKPGETARCEEAAGLLKEVTDKEFHGRSQGISVPLGGGFRYRVGAARGHLVTIGKRWEVADTGVLTVTDRRTVYHGGRKTLEFGYPKLATLNVYSDALDLGVTNRQNTSSFQLADPEFVAGMIRVAVAAGVP